MLLIVSEGGPCCKREPRSLDPHLIDLTVAYFVVVECKVGYRWPPSVVISLYHIMHTYVSRNDLLM